MHHDCELTHFLFTQKENWGKLAHYFISLIKEQVSFLLSFNCSDMAIQLDNTLYIFYL